MDVSQDLKKENEICSAVRDGNLSQVGAFLLQGYDPNSSSDYDLRYMTALERAVDELHIEIAALLFVNGADPTNNIYVGEEPDMASYHGAKPIDVRLGFERAFSEDKPVQGFAGLHLLLRASAGQTGHRRMRCILYLMEASMAQKWSAELTCHTRVAFGTHEAGRIQGRVMCVLMCVRRALSGSRCVDKLIAQFVVLEDLLASFQKVAEGMLPNDVCLDEEAKDHGIHELSEEIISCSVGLKCAASELVIENIAHSEPAVQIHPNEAALISAEVEVGLVGRIVEDGSAHGGWSDQDGDLSVSGAQMNGDVLEEFSRVLVLHFTRHPRSFENALRCDENLREFRECLSRNSFNNRLPSGAWVFVSPGQYSVIKRAVIGKSFTASHVIVSESWEPIVMAAVNAATSHRDNVRVRNAETLAYIGHGEELPIVVERTFLSLPHQMRNSDSVTQSTTSVHGGVNPRRSS